MDPSELPDPAIPPAPPQLPPPPPSPSLATPPMPPPPPPSGGGATFAPPAARADDWVELNVHGASPSAPARSTIRRLVAIGAVVAVGVGGLASVRLLRSTSTASSTPQDAVTQFLHALEGRDLLAAVDTFPKADRELIVEAIDSVSKQSSHPLKNVDLHAVPGFTLSITGLKTTTEDVNDHIALVTLSAGHYRATADLRDLAKRAKLDALAADTPIDALTRTAEGDLASMDTPLQLATVHDGDGWHVSVPYTIAELARRAQKLPAPERAERIAASGAASPEEAAREFANAIVNADWRRAIELTPDDEAAVLHDYGSLFASKLLKDARPFAKVTAFETHTKASGKRTTVVIDKLAADVLPSANADVTSLSIARDGAGCFKATAVTNDGPQDARGCIDDLTKSIRGNDKLASALPADFESKLRALFDGAGFVTVERGGKWFVSPYHTIGSLASVAVFGAVTAFGRAMADATGAIAGAPDVAGVPSSTTRP